MITCIFEHNSKAYLRHVVTHAIVEKNNSLLCIQRADHLLEGGKWALPGGFLDRDETAVEGAKRELLEETGWTSTALTVFRINTDPNRPREDRQNVAIDVLLRPGKKVSSPDEETSKVTWIPLNTILTYSFAFDHSESIHMYLQYKKKKFSLPVVI